MKNGLTKRNKGKNFTTRECSLLLNIIKKDLEIIENKKTDLVSVTEKKDCWDGIAIKFNARTQEDPRSVTQLKNYYDNYKRRKRKDFANDKAAMYNTSEGTLVKNIDGNGPYVISLLNSLHGPRQNTSDVEALLYHDQILPTNDNLDVYEDNKTELIDIIENEVDHTVVKTETFNVDTPSPTEELIDDDDDDDISITPSTSTFIPISNILRKRKGTDLKLKRLSKNNIKTRQSHNESDEINHEIAKLNKQLLEDNIRQQEELHQLEVQKRQLQMDIMRQRNEEEIQLFLIKKEKLVNRSDC